MTVPGRLLVTGGAGFIGSSFVRRMLGEPGTAGLVVLDKLTYAGNLANLADIEIDPRYRFVRGDINDASLVDELAGDVDAIVNFAAESHVDRSIESPDAFIQTDVHGTFTLLEAARRHRHVAYLQVSTDEVYGDVAEGSSGESDPLRPRSPYAASKAAADLLTMAYAATYGVPARITRGSNTFGPQQYPEKMIPLFATNAIDGQPLPLYGDGRQVRDWLYVEDHCSAIQLVLDRGADGEVYNVGGGNSRTNLELTHRILELLDRPADLIRSVPDRPGHDRRYSVDSAKLRRLGWLAEHAFDDALSATIAWYREHEDWWRPLKQGDYLEYYRRQYEARLAAAPPRR